MSIRVLVVDDDPILTTALADSLPTEGFEVAVANSGSDGVEAVRRLEPDVIVLDLMMPGLSGWQVCEEVRTFSQVPILILSSLVDSEGVMLALEKGANDYLVKPVPHGSLAARLRRLARQARINRVDGGSNSTGPG
ncbi:MAG: response regulator [Anaerolineae bacterium]|nr:response regulator [Anaerolineae bacterium]